MEYIARENLTFFQTANLVSLLDRCLLKNYGAIKLVARTGLSMFLGERNRVHSGFANVEGKS